VELEGKSPINFKQWPRFHENKDSESVECLRLYRKQYLSGRK
jgi:hypothetical protein